MRNRILLSCAAFVLASCAPVIPLTRDGTTVRQINPDEARACIFLGTAEYSDTVVGLGKFPSVVQANGEHGLRNRVASMGGNAVIQSRGLADWMWGNVDYVGEAYICGAEADILRKTKADSVVTERRARDRAQTNSENAAKAVGVCVRNYARQHSSAKVAASDVANAAIGACDGLFSDYLSAIREWIHARGQDANPDISALVRDADTKMRTTLEQQAYAVYVNIISPGSAPTQ